MEINNETEEEELYFDQSENFCKECNNLCIININMDTSDLEFVCTLCNTIRTIIYCPYSHKLCIKNDNIFQCLQYGKCKCTNNTQCYTNKLLIKSKIDSEIRFSPNIVYDYTYARTRKFKCECVGENDNNRETIIIMINPQTIDKAFICTFCNKVYLSIINE